MSVILNVNLLFLCSSENVAIVCFLFLKVVSLSHLKVSTQLFSLGRQN